MIIDNITADFKLLTFVQKITLTDFTIILMALHIGNKHTNSKVYLTFKLRLRKTN